MAFVNILMENFSLLAAKRLFPHKELTVTVKQIAQQPIGALAIITAIIIVIIIT